MVRIVPVIVGVKLDVTVAVPGVVKNVAVAVGVWSGKSVDWIPGPVNFNLAMVVKGLFE